VSEIRRIGVIGAGQMGRGIARVCALAGLDVLMTDVSPEALAASKYRPCPLLIKYVEAGWLGRKAGRSFYDYSGETPVPTR
jgi:3-hydroxybutyryl-CoA dehydrogenase